MNGSNLTWKELFNRYREGTLNPTEMELFNAMLLNQDRQSEISQVFEVMSNKLPEDYVPSLDEIKGAVIINGIFKKPSANTYQSGKSAHRVHFLKTAWLRWAAAIIILVGIGTYIFSHTSQPDKEVVIDQPSQKSNEVMPGSNKAILTLSNGEKVELDSATSETIADGKVFIENNAGQLYYRQSDLFALNTMKTPKGGQYQLTLADGTRVWLNAASSITYPTSFTKATREVQVTGEAYFEVTKKKGKPFIVMFNDTKVEVLGTSFNINAYEDEPVSKTTLVSGSIRIQHASSNIILKPNEEAIASKFISVNKNANIKQTLSWKNGVFNFKEQDFATSMRQIERWYDVKVIYDNGIPQKRLWGSAYRTLTLESLIQGLEGQIAHFRLEGRILHVMP